MDARFVSKSGQQTYGLDRFWNGSHSRMAKGLDISTLTWLDATMLYLYLGLKRLGPGCPNTYDGTVNWSD